MTDLHYKVICFDLDDTLWAIDPVIENANKVSYQYLSQHYPEIVTHYCQTKIVSIRNKLIEESPELAHQVSKLRIKIVEQALHNASCPTTLTKKLARETFEVFLEARHQISFFDGAIEALQELKKFYTLGALTNGNANYQRLDLGNIFSFGFSAEQLNASKPSPNHFLAAMHFTKHSAGQLIHIGDHCEHDIWAAHQLGIKTIWVNHKNESWQLEEKPDVEINNLNDVVAAVKAIENASL